MLSLEECVRVAVDTFDFSDKTLKKVSSSKKVATKEKNCPDDYPIENPPLGSNGLTTEPDCEHENRYVSNETAPDANIPNSLQYERANHAKESSADEKEDENLVKWQWSWMLCRGRHFPKDGKQYANTW
jgi:hypothetical protein